MAAAGEDDDDDEDEAPRRGSTSKVGPNGQPAPTKSLKGKESFKSRLPSRAELSRAVSRAKEGKRSKRDRRRRRADRDDGRSRGFIEGILSDEDSSDEDERDHLRMDREDRERRRRDEPQQNEEAQTVGRVLLRVRTALIAGSRWLELCAEHTPKCAGGARLPAQLLRPCPTVHPSSHSPISASASDRLEWV